MGRVCVPKKRRFRNLFFRKKVVTRSLIRIETALKLHLPQISRHFLQENDIPHYETTENMV